MQPKQHSATRRSAIGDVDPDALLNSAQVKARVGNVSDMCLWRWMRDDRVAFPHPVKINNRNYWRLGDLNEWQDRQTQKAAA